MSVRNEVHEVPIKARIPVRICDGCGKLDTDAGGIQVFARDGGTDVYEASRAPASGWNNIFLLDERVLDLCPSCSPQAVLNARKAAQGQAPDAAAQNGGSSAPAAEQPAGKGKAKKTPPVEATVSAAPTPAAPTPASSPVTLVPPPQSDAAK